MQVAVNATTPGPVIGVVRVVQAEAFEGSEVGFDGIEPTGIRRGWDQLHVVLASELPEIPVSVGRQVVQDQVEPKGGGIAGPQPPPSGQEVPRGLPFVDGPVKAVPMHIVESQQLLGALDAPIGGPHPLGMALPCPARSRHRLELHRAEFVEADHGPSRGCLPVELQNPVFFDSN